MNAHKSLTPQNKNVAFEKALPHFSHIGRHFDPRESKVVAAFESHGTTTLEEILPVVYADVPRFMHPVAKFSLLAHAIKLEEEGRAVRDGETWSWRG